MVLFSISTFRKIFLSQSHSQYIEKIVKAIVKLKTDAQTDEIDDDIRGHSGMNVERVGVYDGLSSIYKVPKTGTTVDYYVSEYPDSSIIKSLIYFDHCDRNYSAGIGYVRDMSYYDRDAIMYGDPCIVSGGPGGLILPWLPDYIPSIVSVFDGVTNYAKITDHVDFKVLTTDFSYVVVIYPKSFAQQGAANIRLVTKTDDANNGYVTHYDPATAKVKTQMKKGGVETIKIASTASVANSVFIWVWVTWKSSTSTLKIYINKTDVTTASSGTVPYNATTKPDVYIGAKNDDPITSGKPNMGVYLFAFFRKELTQTEINNMYDNKATISTLTASQVAWTNYSVAQ